jgi:hypothetical protein
MRCARLLISLVVWPVVNAGCGDSKTSVTYNSNVADSHSASGAASVTRITATTTQLGVKAVYVGPISRDDTDPSTGISVTVPPANAKPTLPWQRAVERCFSGAGICNRADGTIRVSVAVGYNPQSGGAAPNGSIRPTMNHDLVYVLAQPLGACAPLGPSGTSTPPSTYLSCIDLSFVDAYTGSGAAAVSGPSVRDPSASSGRGAALSLIWTSPAVAVSSLRSTHGCEGAGGVRAPGGDIPPSTRICQ